jgi:hypothetical protein
MPKLRMKRHAVTQPLDPSYKKIALTQNQSALVDAADFDWLNQWNWCAQWAVKVKSFYAVRNDPPRQISMAREILRCKAKEQADHRNHDTLDNRRKNLRKLTTPQNNWNQGIRSTNTSGRIGVCWHKDRQKWRADIRVKKKVTFLGYFSSIEDATRARDEAARKSRGELAVLNSTFIKRR